ncbi:MAG: RNA polymerase sigma factor [Deltaproteobacteria bacterium]|nr:RNA polymerase sigma factor [Deltaproteobacteria bacterium]
MIHSVSETVIVTALKNGDVRRAVELLLETYQDELYGYCARLVGLASATSVYQRVLAAAVEDIAASQDGSTSLKAWLYGLARNAVTHHHRTEVRSHPAALDPEYAPVEGPIDLPGMRLQDPDVERALAGLDGSTREVLQLTLWHGLKLAEVAAVTGRSVADVRRLATAGLSAVGLGLSVGGSPS